METITSTVSSKDGTRIAYDKIGHGPAVILVAGALCSRSFWSGPELAKLLARSFTMYNYIKSKIEEENVPSVCYTFF